MGEDWDELESIARALIADKKTTTSSKHSRAVTKNFRICQGAAEFTNKHRALWKNQLNAWKAHSKKREKTDD